MVKFVPYEPPLGLAYLAATLRNYNYNVKILDCLALKLSPNQIVDKIKAYEPNVIGIYCLTSNRFDAFATAALAKEASPGSVICMGGPHVSSAAEDTLSHVPTIDVIVRGEGEYSMLDLVQSIEKGECFSKVLGISWRSSEGRIVHNPDRALIQDLDQLPFPARDLLELDRYAYPTHYLPDSVHGKIASIMASRGCVYNCLFCNTPQTWGRKIRYRSPENVADEIELCAAKFGYKAIRFHDDAFTTNKKWVLQFCDELTKRGIDLPWSCCGRVNFADRELFQIMRKSGCYSIVFGAESGSQRILDTINKKITIDQTKSAFRAAQEVGLLTFGYFMLGNPGEDENDFEKTLNLVNELGVPKFNMNITVLYPSNTIFTLAKDSGRIDANFSWTEKIPEIPLKLIGLPFFIDPFCPTLQSEEQIIKYYNSNKDYYNKLIARGKKLKRVHDYGKYFIINPRFWYQNYRKYRMLSKSNTGLRQIISSKFSKEDLSD